MTRHVTRKTIGYSKNKKEDNKCQNGQNANAAHDELVIMSDYGNGCMIADCEVSWLVDLVFSCNFKPKFFYYLWSFRHGTSEDEKQ